MIFHPSDWWDHSFHFLHKNACAADRVSKSPLRKKKHKRWRETDKNVKYLKSSILYITYSHTFNFKRFVHHLLLIVRLWNWHDESIRWRPISLKYVWRNLEKKKILIGNLTMCDLLHAAGACNCMPNIKRFFT